MFVLAVIAALFVAGCNADILVGNDSDEVTLRTVNDTRYRSFGGTPVCSEAGWTGIISYYRMEWTDSIGPCSVLFNDTVVVDSQLVTNADYILAQRVQDMLLYCSNLCVEVTVSQWMDTSQSPPSYKGTICITSPDGFEVPVITLSYKTWETFFCGAGYNVIQTTCVEPSHSYDTSDECQKSGQS